MNDYGKIDMKNLNTIKIYLIAGLLLLAYTLVAAEEVVADSMVATPLEPYDALSLPRELKVRLMDPWEPLEAISTTDEPRIPAQMRVRDYTDAFDVLAPPDD